MKSVESKNNDLCIDALNFISAVSSQLTKSKNWFDSAIYI